METAVRAVAEILNRFDFNPEIYRSQYPDLAIFGDNLEQYARHYILFGCREGRILSFQCSTDGPAQFAKSDNSVRGELKRCLLRSMAASVISRSGNLIEEPHPNLKELLALSELGFQPYLVIGDSHSVAYAPHAFALHNLLPLLAACGGGSGRGLANPKSRSGYRQKIQHLLKTVGSAAARPVRTLFCFGQVDVEFVYYFRAIERGDVSHSEPLRDFMLSTIARYLDFIRDVTHRTVLKPAVAGIFPPCLSDDTVKSGYVNAHIASLHSDLTPVRLAERVLRFSFPNWVSRTIAHREFNSLLEAECSARKIPFINVAARLLGDDQVISPRYFDHGGADHHLSFHRIRDDILSEILPVAAGTRRQHLSGLAQRRIARMSDRVFAREPWQPPSSQWVGTPTKRT